MLLGDGSPTRHLQLLTNQETKIKLISMQLDPLFNKEGPQELNQLNGPLIRRQVWITNNNKNLAWAESWWNAEQVNENLKAKEEGLEVKNAVMASDAFFPFRDGIDKAASSGIAAIIQPGGSIKDEEVIVAANEHNIAMIFTGMRHFRH